MVAKRSFCVWAVLALLVSLGIGVGGATSAMDELGTEAAAGTAFTYQGQLRDGSGPVNATCDLQFKLWDASGGGAQVGGTILLEDVVLVEGLFTARLDFGAAAFRGQARYLEVAASCPAGSAFVPLPRQELTGSPYALWALGAPWTGLEGVPADLADGDQDTTYSAGAGLVLEGTEFRVNRGEVQWRVSETCAAGSSIRAIDVDGTVTCEADTDTTYGAGTGLSLVGGQFSVNFGGSGTAATASRSDHNHDAAYVNEGQANSVSTGMVQNNTLLLEDLNQNGCDPEEIIKWNGGTWACAADQTGAGSYWSLTGNAGTAPGTNYLGTSDNTALVLRVNGTRALSLEPSNEAPNLIGGWWENYVTAGVRGATISGGGSGDYGENRVTDDFGTVGGGYNNQAGDNEGTLNDRPYATVGGGQGNIASGSHAIVGGGRYNTAFGEYATVGGGSGNWASFSRSTVGGGGDNTASSEGATVGGGIANTASDEGATVGGGQGNEALEQHDTVGGGYYNIAGGPNATIGGGRINTAGGNAATVGGGYGNRVTDNWGMVGGGYSNQAGDYAGTYEDRPYATVGGGYNNTASGPSATIGGGWTNTAAGNAATVPGGAENNAGGGYSFAAGAQANASHDGSFVWSSGTATDSWGANTFTARSHGGARFYSAAGTGTGVQLAAGGTSFASISDRNAKEAFAPVDTGHLLEVLAGMPVQSWNLKSQSPEMRHIGPVAQDFNGSFAYLFGEVESPIHINTMDAVGISLAASQGLYEQVQALEAENAILQDQLGDLEDRLTALEAGRGAGSSSARLPGGWWLLGSVVAVGLVIGRRAWGGG